MPLIRGTLSKTNSGFSRRIEFLTSFWGAKKGLNVQGLVVGRVVNLRLLWYDLRPFWVLLATYIDITHWKVKSSATNVLFYQGGLGSSSDFMLVVPSMSWLCFQLLPARPKKVGGKKSQTTTDFGCRKPWKIMGKTTNLNWFVGFLNHQHYLKNVTCSTFASTSSTNISAAHRSRVIGWDPTSVIWRIVTEL